MSQPRPRSRPALAPLGVGAAVLLALVLASGHMAQAVAVDAIGRDPDNGEIAIKELRAADLGGTGIAVRDGCLHGAPSGRARRDTPASEPEAVAHGGPGSGGAYGEPRSVAQARMAERERERTPGPESGSAPLLGVHAYKPGSDDAPPLGVFTHGNAIQVQPFQDLVEMPVTIWMTSVPWDAWEHLRAPGWKYDELQASMQANPNVRVVMMHPLLPSSEGHGHSALVKGAAGQYNEHYRVFARRLKDRRIDDLIIRASWEFTGGWYPWGINNNTTNGQPFAQMWRHFVLTVRDEFPDNNFVFEWNPHQGTTTAVLEAAWPGADVVDVVSMSVYDEHWGPCQRFDLPCRWQTTKANIDRVAAIAAKYNKPMAITEYGVWDDGGTSSDTRGGGDNDYYIKRMWEYFLDPASRVAYHVYFNVRANGEHRLEMNPKALAAFREHGRSSPTPTLRFGLD
jgi:hypothetical protein